MAKALNTEFPRLRIGGDPDSITGGLSQIHTCAPVAALFGQEVVYSREGWPENRRRLLDDEAADALGGSGLRLRAAVRGPDAADGPHRAGGGARSTASSTTRGC